jgi:hypothetical protein
MSDGGALGKRALLPDKNNFPTSYQLCSKLLEEQHPDSPPAESAPASPEARPPAASSPPALAPDPTENGAPPPAGYDPADYRWVPVRRRPRTDGWTEEKQRRFIEVLADTGLVAAAAKAVGMSRETAYRLRRSPHGAAFARAWDAARGHAGGLVEEWQVKHAPSMFQDRPGDDPTCHSPSNARSRGSSTMSMTRMARWSARSASTTTAYSCSCFAT